MFVVRAVQTRHDRARNTLLSGEHGESGRIRSGPTWSRRPTGQEAAGANTSVPVGGTGISGSSHLPLKTIAAEERRSRKTNRTNKRSQRNCLRRISLAVAHSAPPYVEALRCASASTRAPRSRGGSLVRGGGLDHGLLSTVS